MSEERPSVLERLEHYKTQLDQQQKSAPTRTKNRQKSKKMCIRDRNDTKDTFVLTDKGRSIIRGQRRDEICPSREPPEQVKKPKKRGMER